MSVCHTFVHVIYRIQKKVRGRSGKLLVHNQDCGVFKCQVIASKFLISVTIPVRRNILNLVKMPYCQNECIILRG